MFWLIATVVYVAAIVIVAALADKLEKDELPDWVRKELEK